MTYAVRWYAGESGGWYSATSGDISDGTWYLPALHGTIDGLTGGFNFQAAWTTGWIAGKAMAR